MNILWRIGLLMLVVSVLGCAAEVPQAQTPQPTSATEQEAQQPKKPAFPTFTYRPG